MYQRLCLILWAWHIRRVITKTYRKKRDKLLDRLLCSLAIEFKEGYIASVIKPENFEVYSKANKDLNDLHSFYVNTITYLDSKRELNIHRYKTTILERIGEMA